MSGDVESIVARMKERRAANRVASEKLRREADERSVSASKLVTEALAGKARPTDEPGRTDATAGNDRAN